MSSDQKRAEEKKNRQEMLIEASLIRKGGSHGGLMTFNAEFGYLEALVRGYKSGFIKESEYRALCNCDNLDDVKLTLGDTDYVSVLSQQAKLTPDSILNKIVQKTIDEFNFLRAEAVGQLSTFLDFMTYEYVIKNVCFVISGLLKGADPEALLAKCHPLGQSPHLKAVLTFESQTSSDGLVDLYRTVLVETPVARYFEIYFNLELKSDQPTREIQRVYNEAEIDVVTTMLQKLWLEDFYKYCLALGGETAATMAELLEFEADRRTISIILNSFDVSELNDPQSRDNDRKALFCNFGKLYPECTLPNTRFSKASDAASLQSALEPYNVYRNIWKKAQETAEARRSFNERLTDLFFEHEVKLLTLAFMGQSHFACFYAYVKLKEREHANLKWILACINQKRDSKDLNRWIKIL